MKKWIIIVVLTLIGLTAVIVTGRKRAETSSARVQGMAAVKEKRYDAAVTHFDAYLAEHPGDSVAWVARGNALLQLERYDDAEDSYGKALDVDNRSARALNGLGLLHRRKNDLPKAVEYYQRALAVDSSYVPTYLCLSAIEIERGDAKAALKHAQRAFDLERSNPMAAAYLAVAYHMNGMTEERDEMTIKARAFGYEKMDDLARIYRKKKPEPDDAAE